MAGSAAVPRTPAAGAPREGRGEGHAIREAIRDKALASGFDAVGFAPAALGQAAAQDLREFLARGYHGDMGWLAASAERRADPRALWADARSVVVLAVNYAPEDDPPAPGERPETGVVSV